MGGMTRPVTAALLLAAGSGSRMGTPKALVELAGRLLVDRAVEQLVRGGCDPVLVVLGAAADEVEARADLERATVVRNPDHATGMGSSLRAGLAAATATGADAVLVSLVDQPGSGADVVARLLDAAVRAPWADALVAGYDGAPRNPVLLRRAVWDDVAAAAEGDVGARPWLRANPDRVAVVECADLGHADDLDTPADLDRARRAAQG